MKKIIPTLLIFLCLIIYIYTCSVVFLPKNIILFEGERINLNTLAGIKINQMQINQVNPNSLEINKYEILQTSISTTKTNDKSGKISLSLDLFGKIPLKEIDIDVIPRTKVVPLGNSIGLRLYTEGVLVVGMSEIKGIDNIKHKPYENSGIKEGDTIIAVNNNQIANTQDLIKQVNQSNGDSLKIKYKKEESKEIITTNITPIKTENNEYKLGLWVRDAAEGVGTISFYEPSTNKFAALGHPITDVDTGDIINISNGELITSKIVSIIKGENGKPGEIRGIISNGNKIGEIAQNTKFGIFGQVIQLSSIETNSENQAIDVSLRSEIEKGKAYILCEIEDGITEKYEIEIQKIYSGNNYDNKSMLIKVTDKRLLEKTGGIIQRNEWKSNNTKR